MGTEQDALTALVVQAMFTSLDEKKREELLKGALQHIVEKKRDEYGRETKKSLLEECYQNAMYQIAQKEVERLLQDDPKVREMISSVIKEAVEVSLVNADLRQKLVTSLAAGISDAFTPKGRY